MRTLIRRLRTDEKGQDLVEYTLLLAFVVLGSGGLMLGQGTSVSRIWTSANTALQLPSASVSPQPIPAPPVRHGDDESR
jgi:Flp pilus assembly pilin Flp